jgi:DNA mismatch endonuclease (patch repair protein)
MWIAYLPDIMDAGKRSALMSRIRGRNTMPERALRSELFRRGLRYRVHLAGLPGKPDIVFTKARLAVFVHGCFWHGCPLHYNKPVSRAAFWAEKLQSNRDRDARVSAALRADGWRVLDFWEHEVEEDVAAVADKVQAGLNALRARGGPRGRQPRRASAAPRSRSG